MNEREIDWAHAITWVCPSGGVMYICENRLSCPRKVKSVLTTTLCWSAEPLKVALKVKMISAALHIIITLHISNESAFLNVQLNERWPTQRQSLTATVWRNNETALTETRLKHAGEISTEKYLVSQIRGSELTVLYYIYNIYIYIYILYANNRLSILLSGLCFVIWTVILSFSSFTLLHFLFQRDLVSVPLVSEYDLVTSYTYTQIIYII